MSCIKFKTGDVIGFAVDYHSANQATIYVYKNGVFESEFLVDTTSSAPLIPTVSYKNADQSSVTFLTYEEVLEESVPFGFTVLEADVETGFGTEYISDLGYIDPNPASTAPIEYTDVVADLPVFKRSITVGFNTTSNQTFGDINIINNHGEYDSWLSRSWNGRDVRMYYGEKGWTRENFRLITTAIAHELTSPNETSLTLKIRDTSVLLTLPIKMSNYPQGHPQEGQEIPLCYGKCFQITPVLVDGTLQKYQVHDGRISGIRAVYDNGYELDEDQYSFDWQEGTFILNQAPSGTVTCDVWGSLHPDMSGDGLNSCGFSIFDSSYRISEHHILSTGSAISTQALTSTGSQYAYSSHSKLKKFYGKYTLNFKVDTGYASAGIVGDSIWVGVSNAYSTIGEISGTGSFAVCSNGDIKVDGTLYTAGTFTPPNDVTTINLPFGVGDMITFLTDFDSNNLYVSIAGSNFFMLAQGNAHEGYISTSIKNGFSVEVDATHTLRPAQIGYEDCWDIASTTPNFQPTIAQIIFDILSKKSELNSSDFDLESFYKFDSKYGQSVGLYIDSADTVGDIIATLLNSCGGYWTFNKQGKVSLGYLVDPSEQSPTKDILIVEDDIREGQLILKSRMLPYSSINVGYLKYYTTQDKDGIAGGVKENDPTFAENLGKSYRYSLVEDTTTATYHKLSQANTQWDTLIESKSQAEDLAEEKLVLFSKIRDTYSIEVGRILDNVNIGDIIQVQVSRYGFQNTKNVLVTGISESHNPEKTVLEVWL